MQYYIALIHINIVHYVNIYANMEIVLVMLNTFQEYIFDAIQCLRKFNNHKIVVLTDCVLITNFESI